MSTAQDVTNGGKPALTKKRILPEVVAGEPSGQLPVSKKPKSSTKDISKVTTAPATADDETKRKEALPIFQYKQQILTSVLNHATTVVVGETGSGKSTQIPQFLASSTAISRGKCVVCTQPRRVAAITIAEQVAKERRARLGEEVGYSIRFEDKTSKRTRIKYATDGVLLREIMSDPLLSQYSVVLLDEAHERSMQTDILMGLLKEVQKVRRDLKIIVMSATLQVELFQSFFQVRKRRSPPVSAVCGLTRLPRAFCAVGRLRRQRPRPSVPSVDLLHARARGRLHRRGPHHVSPGASSPPPAPSGALITTLPR